jgi:hypothetical protein
MTPVAADATDEIQARRVALSTTRRGGPIGSSDILHGLQLGLGIIVVTHDRRVSTPPMSGGLTARHSVACS